MTDKYETGVWYGWNGGECPVHPKTVVEIIFDDGSGPGSKELAQNIDWRDAYGPCVFRVVTPYVEPPKPLECWVNVYPYGIGSGAFETKAQALSRAGEWCIRTVRMVEVTDE